MLSKRSIELSIALMIKKRIAGLKYALGLTVLNLIILWRTGAFNSYIWNAAAVIALLGILFPVLIEDMENALYQIIRVTRILLTLLFIGIMHIAIFPLIRLLGLIFGKHFIFPSVDTELPSYFSEKNNDWEGNMKEPF